MAADKKEVMRSLEDNCTQHKNVYESCFNRWFRDDFLKGSKSDHQSVCGELFSTYQDCLKKGLEKKGLNIPELYEDMLNTSKEKIPP